MNSVRIEILGAAFSIQTDEGPEHIAELVAMVKKRVQLVQAQTNSTDSLKVAILSSLMLADELQARPATPPLRPIGEPFSDDDEEAERIAMRLISDIDERLPR